MPWVCLGIPPLLLIVMLALGRFERLTLSANEEADTQSHPRPTRHAGAAVRRAATPRRRVRTARSAPLGTMPIGARRRGYRHAIRNRRRSGNRPR